MLHAIEQVLVAIWDEGGVKVDAPFHRMTWQEAMEKFGVDKPDLRYALEIGISRSSSASTPRRS